MDKIYQFEPILKPVLWGGDKLARLKGVASAEGQTIGESWELSGVTGHESIVAGGHEAGATLTQLVERHGASLVGEHVWNRCGTTFPLLVKVIDARQDLSLQVHPDDDMARRFNSNGKTEMWYIVDTNGTAHIRTGFNRVITAQEYERRIADNTILDVVRSQPSQAGDVFFIPAGMIHAIGAGNLLVEVQQSSDITYRVYDYDRRDAQGNPRELHTALAREALHYDTTDGYQMRCDANAQGVTRLVRCPYFEVSRLDYDNGFELELPSSFLAMVCLKGGGTVSADGEEPVALHDYTTLLVSASAHSLTFTGAGQLVLASVPNN